MFPEPDERTFLKEAFIHLVEVLLEAFTLYQLYDLPNILAYAVFVVTRFKEYNGILIVLYLKFKCHKLNIQLTVGRNQPFNRISYYLYNCNQILHMKKLIF